MTTDQLDAMRAIILAVTKDLNGIIAKHPDQFVYQHEGESTLRNGKRVTVIITVINEDY